MSRTLTLLALPISAAVSASFIVASWAGLGGAPVVVLVFAMVLVLMGLAGYLLAEAAWTRRFHFVWLADVLALIACAPLISQEVVLVAEEWVARRQVLALAEAADVEVAPPCWGFPPCESTLELQADGLCLVQHRGWYTCWTCTHGTGHVEPRECDD